MPSNTRSKIIFITGGSRGIGKAIVDLFKQKHWIVATCACSKQALKHSAADYAFACNVSDPNEVKDALTELVIKFPKIDVLVNNAGVAGTNPLEKNSSDELWHNIVNVNLNGTYYVTKFLIDHLHQNGGGRIINIASVLALKGVADQTAYCAAKHGVLGFTRALAHYLAPQKITVNAICPGWVRTDMAVKRMRELDISEKKIKTSLPLGDFVEPIEVAQLVEYLSSEQAKNITGQALTMDGGVTC